MRYDDVWFFNHIELKDFTTLFFKFPYLYLIRRPIIFGLSTHELAIYFDYFCIPTNRYPITPRPNGKAERSHRKDNERFSPPISFIPSKTLQNSWNDITVGIITDSPCGHWVGEPQWGIPKLFTFSVTFVWQTYNKNGLNTLDFPSSYN